MLHDTVIRGVPTSFTVHLASTQVGPIAVELLQPVDGPSIFQEWLDRHAGAPAVAESREEFNEFLSRRQTAGDVRSLDSPDEREALFRQFLEWNRKQQLTR